MFEVVLFIYHKFMFFHVINKSVFSYLVRKLVSSTHPFLIKTSEHIKSTNLAQREIVDGHLRLGINCLKIPAKTLTLQTLTKLTSFRYITIVRLLHT